MAASTRRPIDANRREGFTLIEVLIVVVIMAVLAGVAITSFFDTSGDAKQSVLVHDLYTLRAQINLYALHHGGMFPKLVDGTLPQLTTPTNELGEMGSPGNKYPYGPYFEPMPTNPFNESDKVVAVATPYQTPTAPADNSSGWQYDEATGQIWPNHAEYFESGGVATVIESGAVAAPTNP